jgi:Reverse transcriptase (RNA-dependent DNA polymerase).
MEFYGILGETNKIIQSYLNNRYQRVLLKYNSVKYFSNWEPVKHGVPQGTILGPLFHLLYINDLPRIMSDKSKPILFADDRSIIITNSILQSLKKMLTMFLSK